MGILALVQSVGLIISLYLLVSNYTDEGRYDDPRSHVCVEPLLCLMYRYGPELDQTGQTNTALAAQLVFSLLAITVNCVLVCGALANNNTAFLPWLLLYGILAMAASLSQSSSVSPSSSETTTW